MQEFRYGIFHLRVSLMFKGRAGCSWEPFCSNGGDLFLCLTGRTPASGSRRCSFHIPPQCLLSFRQCIPSLFGSLPPSLFTFALQLPTNLQFQISLLLTPLLSHPSLSPPHKFQPSYPDSSTSKIPGFISTARRFSYNSLISRFKYFVPAPNMPCVLLCRSKKKQSNYLRRW